MTPVAWLDEVHEHGHRHVHQDHEHVPVTPRSHAVAPSEPSRAVLLDVGENTGALILRSSASFEGREVEIHPVLHPERRTHVWILPRQGRESTVYAAVFPSLPAGDYAVIGPDGSVTAVVPVPANEVTSTNWV